MLISLTLKKSLNFPSRNCCDSRKILSQNFLFLELRSPGKFCPGKKIVLEFSKNNSTKNGHSRNLQSWNFPSLEFIFVLELSVPGILFHGIFLLPFHYTYTLEGQLFTGLVSTSDHLLQYPFRP